jgi:hypothetical protein
VKSVVLQEVLNRTYYLGQPNNLFWFDEDDKLHVNSSSKKEGRVSSKEEHVEWEVILETEKFTRELKSEEFIKTDEDYKIIKVSHAANGSIQYYINKKRIIEDEESKKVAENDLEKRRLILEDRRRCEEDRVQYEKICGLSTNKPIKKRKWFWI